MSLEIKNCSMYLLFEILATIGLIMLFSTLIILFAGLYFLIEALIKKLFNYFKIKYYAIRRR